MAAAVEDYRRLSALSDDEAGPLLINHLLADEQRNLRLLQSLCEGLGDTGEGDAGEREVERQAALEESLRLLRSLIRDEQESTRSLRYLARQEATIGDQVRGVLLEALARDSGTHELILRFLLRRHETQAIQETVNEHPHSPSS